jgi:serine/threonine protein kinase
MARPWRRPSATDTARKNLPFWLGARIVGDVARGLHAAHELADNQGNPLHLVHRDVSPQNIIVLYDGMAKILDFGIARARGRLTQTEAQEVKGKIAYMSPEQLHGQPIDRRSDVWSLGVVLWESTVGARLFRGDTEGQTTLNVIHKDIPRPTQVPCPNYPLRPSKPRSCPRWSATRRSARVKTAAAVADAVDDRPLRCGQSPPVHAPGRRRG